MNFYYFLSKRISQAGEKSFSGLVYVIAIASVAISLAVMIVSFSILNGFKINIQDKIFSFGGHLQISKYDVKKSMEENPLSILRPIYQTANLQPEILHIQAYSHKAALLKNKEGVSGIVLKGIGKNFDTSRFTKNIISGHLPYLNDTSYSKTFAVSRRLADKMRISLGDTVLIYFVQNPPRYRKLAICGIYETSMEEFDDVMAFCDIRLNQKMNNWPDTLVGGYEIFVKDFSQLDSTAAHLLQLLDYDMQMEKVTDKYIQLFEWLKLLDRNVVIFLALILLVAGFNIISTLFIIIMERTQMIGVMKALGASNVQLQKIFFYLGLQITIKGLILGNLIGLSFCAIQYYFNIISLDANTYYMAFAPVHWDWVLFGLLNITAFGIITLVLLIPVLIIANIKPINSIKWN